MRDDLVRLYHRLAHRLGLRGEPVRRAFPAAPEPDRAKLSADLARKPAQIGYMIHFTPRSGSSWLGDIAQRSGGLGRPGEMFNPNFMPRIAQALNATTLDEYCTLLPRRQARGGVWGFEVTHHQIGAVFESEDDFLARFGHLPAVFLVRRDIVAQGVSLAKMQATKLTHSTQVPADRIAEAERGFVYDAEDIRTWILHIRAAERGTEAMFERAGILPLRMSYEENVALPPEHLVRHIARHIGRPGSLEIAPGTLESPHVKIGTGLNAAHAERFRTEEAGWLTELEAERQEMLDRIEPYGPEPGHTGARGRSE